MKRLTHHLSLLAGQAANTAKAFGESLRCRLWYSFDVLRIHLTPFLAGALRFIQMRKSSFMIPVRDEGGYLMPTVIILIVVMSTVAYATLIQANSSLNLAYKQSYIQMAREASKAAIDYAQERFDTATCGNYNGTPETDLTGPANSRYRITMQADVVSTSPDGYEKNVRGTGRIYLPKASAEALYVFDIRSEIVRTYAVCKTPDNFAPLVWLDASNTASLKKIGVSTTTVTPNTSYGSAGDSTRDTLEERADNGTQTAASWQSNDFEMNTCDASEFSTSICNSNSTKYLNNGLIFSNVNVPNGATITSATITLNCTTPAGTGGSLSDRIYGFYNSATNLHPDLFTSTGSNQLRTPLTTASLRTSSFASVSSNNCPPGNNTVFDVTNVAQEIVNNVNWDPATGGGRMGFLITRTSGSGSRHFLKTGNQFSISYSTATVNQALNGDGLGQWDDISGNGNNAKFVYGNAPTRVDNQINAKTVVRFNNGAFVSTLTSALSGQREFTAFAVIKPNFSTSASAGRVISGMTTTGTNDTGGTNSIIPLRRQSNSSGFSGYYANSSSYEVTMGCSAACSDTPYLIDSNFAINTDDDTIIGRLRGNGDTQGGVKTDIAPAGSPYTFGINELYFGGRRSGVLPGSGTDYFNGDYAELVVYSKTLSCREIESLEEYFRAKWAIAASQWTSTCPPDTIPTL